MSREVLFCDLMEPVVVIIVNKYSQELTECEITFIMKNKQMSKLIHAIWGFTGHFFRWPQALLARNDIPESICDVLSDNLNDELGKSGEESHTELFRKMALSLGIRLPDEAPFDPLISKILNDAVTLSPAKAIGQFFANESTIKWRGFLEVFSKFTSINTCFFDVHTCENNHYESLLNAFPIENAPDLVSGAIEFSRCRASFMNELRLLLGIDAKCLRSIV